MEKPLLDKSGVHVHWWVGVLGLVSSARCHAGADYVWAHQVSHYVCMGSEIEHLVMSDCVEKVMEVIRCRCWGVRGRVEEAAADSFGCTSVPTPDVASIQYIWRLHKARLLSSIRIYSISASCALISDAGIMSWDTTGEGTPGLTGCCCSPLVSVQWIYIAGVWSLCLEL